MLIHTYTVHLYITSSDTLICWYVVSTLYYCTAQACNEAGNQCVHGAYTSGKRAAEQIVHHFARLRIKDEEGAGGVGGGVGEAGEAGAAGSGGVGGAEGEAVEGRGAAARPMGEANKKEDDEEQSTLTAERARSASSASSAAAAAAAVENNPFHEFAHVPGGKKRKVVRTDGGPRPQDPDDEEDKADSKKVKTRQHRP